MGRKPGSVGQAHVGARGESRVPTQTVQQKPQVPSLPLPQLHTPVQPPSTGQAAEQQNRAAQHLPAMVAIASYCAVSLKWGSDTSTGCTPLGSAGGTSTLPRVSSRGGKANEGLSDGRGAAVHR